MRQYQTALKFLIHQKFLRQNDFAAAAEPAVCAGTAQARTSRVMNGYEKLTPVRAARWAAVLGVDPKLLSSITQPDKRRKNLKRG